ncbi:MAG TPA: NAD(P)-dependent oxidoreductase [Burkholderiales bacterium]|nr:NAD(P)-dependent oxidoreductase [Burkholderiales bacterium]
MSAPRVGFVGIGNMGWPMAKRVAGAGFPLTVFDTDVARVARFAAETRNAGAETGAALARAADIVITMLPTGAVVRDALLGAGGVARSLARGAVVVDMSSSDPNGTRELGRGLAELGVALVDAPVSGGVPRAEAGTLAIMIGGEDEAAIARVRPVLETMGAKLFRTGPLGSGHAMKALNNYVAAAAFAATSEALLVGRRFGLEPAVMVEVMNASSGRSFNTDIVFPDHVVGGKFAAGFALGLMAKDVGIAAGLAREIGVDSPLCRLTSELWSGARDALGGTADFTAAYKHWAARGG